MVPLATVAPLLSALLLLLHLPCRAEAEVATWARCGS